MSTKTQDILVPIFFDFRVSISSKEYRLGRIIFGTGSLGQLVCNVRAEAKMIDSWSAHGGKADRWIVVLYGQLSPKPPSQYQPLSVQYILHAQNSGDLFILDEKIRKRDVNFELDDVGTKCMKSIKECFSFQTDYFDLTSNSQLTFLKRVQQKLLANTYYYCT